MTWSILGVLLILSGQLSATATGRGGGLDPTFGNGGMVETRFPEGKADAFSVAIAPDGKIVAAGAANFDVRDDSGRYAVARYLRDGRLDPTFGRGGRAVANFGRGALAEGLVVEPDGSVITAGGDTNTKEMVAAKFTPSGQLDPAFGSGGSVHVSFPGSSGAVSAALQPDGRIVLAGGCACGDTGGDFALARLMPDGSLDSSFGTNGEVTTSLGYPQQSADAMTLDPQGRILLTGWWSDGDLRNSHVVILRYLADGSLDSSWHQGESDPFAYPFDVLAQPNGDVLVVNSEFPGCTGEMIRYHSDGSNDVSFGLRGNGFVSRDYVIWTSAALQRNGKIVLAGATNCGDVPSDRFAIFRYLADGRPDRSFGTRGETLTTFPSGGGSFEGVAVQTNRKIVAAGCTLRGRPPQPITFAVARYLAN
jgi:uncharacterized delta-60 repeat protein